MSIPIKNLFVKTFDPELKKAYGDDGDSLRQYVRKDGKVIGDTVYFNKQAKAVATKWNRGSRSVPVNLSSSRVSATMVDWEVYDYVYEPDINKLNFKEIGHVASAFATAMRLRFDQDIIDELEAGITTNIIASDASKMDVDDLISAKFSLDQYGVPPKDRTFLHDVGQLADLLETTEVTSSDFAMVKALVMGEVNTFMGFKFVGVARNREEGGLPDGATPSTSIRGFVFHKAAIGQGIGDDIKSSAEWVQDMDGWGVRCKGTVGSKTIDVEGIVAIDTLKRTA